ncbi:MAG: hypothetical protein K2W96_19245 [Gemmataceae bacterium]|nr:hypothetical protein [Gemmataceae bacterium]
MTRDPLEPVRQAFADPSRGIEGLADRLLGLARSGIGLELEFDRESAGCRTVARFSDATAFGFVPVPKPVFRAVLVRFSILCRDQSGQPVSPYSGSAELGPVSVSFSNTPDSQRLELETPVLRRLEQRVATPSAAFPVDDAAGVSR